jgi:hypothetical protein
MDHSAIGLQFATASTEKYLVRRTIRTGVINTSMALGEIGAVWWGLKHPEHVGRCSKHRPGPLALQHCIGSTFGAVMTHWAVVLGVGFGVGALLGIALALLIRVPRSA